MEKNRQIGGIMRYWIFALVLALLLFGVASTPHNTFAQAEDGTCSDGIDNDADGLIDKGDDDCLVLSEATSTPNITPTPEPVREPHTTTTPSAFPVAGDDSGSLQSQADQSGTEFTEWVTQMGLIGVFVSFFVTATTAIGITVTSASKRITCIVIAVVCSVLYIATKDNVQIESVNDVTGTLISVLVSSQVAYVLATEAMGRVLPRRSA